MPILIDKALKHFYMLQESLILCKHGNILLSLTLKKKTIQTVLLYTYCRNTYQQGSKHLQTYNFENRKYLFTVFHHSEESCESNHT